LTFLNVSQIKAILFVNCLRELSEDVMQYVEKSLPPPSSIK